jgi:hypothetical protein
VVETAANRAVFRRSHRFLIGWQKETATKPGNNESCYGGNVDAQLFLLILPIQSSP